MAAGQSGAGLARRASRLLCGGLFYPPPPSTFPTPLSGSLINFSAGLQLETAKHWKLCLELSLPQPPDKSEER